MFWEAEDCFQVCGCATWVFGIWDNRAQTLAGAFRHCRDGNVSGLRRRVEMQEMHFI